jgi:uncharacterized protein YjdB
MNDAPTDGGRLRRILILSLVLAACGSSPSDLTGGPGDPVTGPITPTMSIAPANATFTKVGESLQFIPTWQPISSADKLIWSSSDSTRVSVAQTGVAVALRATITNVNICAAHSADPAQKGCAQASVQLP